MLNHEGEEFPQMDADAMSKRVDELMEREKRRMGYKLPDEETANEFLKKADDVHQKVKDIIEGKIELTEVDR